MVSGFSGAGKGTVTRQLIGQYEGYALSISVTTRSPRDYEEEGKDYFFISHEQFRSLIERDALYEYAEYQGQFYGTPKSYVDQCLNQGLDIILEIDVQGAAQIKEKFPDTLLVFVTTPDIGTLVERLEGRGTESREKIRGRLMRARAEAGYIERYDYLLVNDDLDEAVSKLHQMIRTEHCACRRSPERIRRLAGDLESLVY